MLGKGDNVSNIYLDVTKVSNLYNLPIDCCLRKEISAFRHLVVNDSCTWWMHLSNHFTDGHFTDSSSWCYGLIALPFLTEVFSYEAPSVNVCATATVFWSLFLTQRHSYWLINFSSMGTIPAIIFLSWRYFLQHLFRDFFVSWSLIRIEGLIYKSEEKHVRGKLYIWFEGLILRHKNA